MGKYADLVAQYKQEKQTQKAPSDAAVLASSLAKGVAGIPVYVS